MRLFNNKRGWGGIVVIIVVLLLVFALVNMFVFKAFSSVNDFMQDDDDLSNTSKEVVQDLEDRYPSTFDGAFMLILALSTMLFIVISYNADNNPLLMVVAILIMLFLLLGTIVLSVSYSELVSDSEISGFTTDFPMSHWVLDHFGMVGLGMITSMLLAMFIKQRY